ncbi:MAG: HNH endonuclease [Proteobacteria bacterium]|nr:HNH endonuclease [Pseudomonadota bacterium]
MTDADEGMSHVAGILIPVMMRPYFPRLPQPAAANPAPAVPVTVEMVIPGQTSQRRVASYQFQTRANKRNPEARLTNIDSFRKAASTGDVALIERATATDDLFRLTLVKSNDPRHGALVQRLSSGSIVLDATSPPVKLTDVEAAAAEIEERTQNPFELFDADAQWISRGRRIARAKAFSRLVLAAYGRRCAMCGAGLLHPDGRSEVEAAHIVGRGARGADDVRNGIALCRAHHWAFDNLLVGLDPSGTIKVHPAVTTVPESASLATLAGQSLRAPSDASDAPHPDALAWISARFDEQLQP